MNLPEVLTVTLNPALDQTCLVDGFGLNREFVIPEYYFSAGGKGFNCSRALHHLRVPSLATGILGGWVGKKVKDLLAKEKISGRYVLINGETRLNWTVLDRSNESSTRVIHEGPKVLPKEIKQFKTLYSRLLKRHMFVILSGRNAQGAPSSIYADLIKKAHLKKASVILDAMGQELRKGLRAKPYLIKPNVEEAEDALGEPLRSTKKLRYAVSKFLKMGAEHVILSCDSEGALASDGVDLWHIRPPRIRLLNPVGCGDSLIAGCVWALRRSQPFYEAVKWGVATATENARGLHPGVLNRKGIKNIYQKLRITGHELPKI